MECAPQPLRAPQGWEAVPGRGWHTGDGPTGSHNPKNAAGTRPQAPAAPARPWEHPDSSGLGMLGSAGPVPAQGSAQARKQNPQEPFTSRAKLTSFEGREEPSAGPCPLQTSGHLLHWLFPQWENNIFLGFNHQGKTSSLTELPTPALSPACPPRSLSHLQSPPILTFPSLISSGKGKTSNHWIIEQEREHGRCSTCKPRRIH